jgi:hypothetical protein
MAIGEPNPTSGWPLRWLPLPENRSSSLIPAPLAGVPEKVAVTPPTIATIISGFIGSLFGYRAT